MLRIVLVFGLFATLAGLSGDRGSADSGPARQSLFVFARAVPGSEYISDLYVARADGQGLRRLTTDRQYSEIDSRNAVSQDPAWSPDGRAVAYSRGSPLINASSFQRVESAEIMVIDTQSKRSKRIASGIAYGRPTVDASPAWSPDGRFIAFVRSTHYGKQPGIFIVGSDGKGLRRVAKRAAVSVDWSPDGKSLAYAAGFPDLTSDGRVGTIDLATGSTRQFRVPHAYDVSWSPSGHQLAVVGGDFTGNFGLAIATSRGHLIRRIPTRGPAIGVTWSPDGQQLAYGTRSGVYVVRSDGQNTRQFLSNAFSPDWNH